MKYHRSFVSNVYERPADYVVPHDAPALISSDDRDVVRYDLLETGAPSHTKNYMNGLDVLGWTTAAGLERSQLIIDQKAGALVVLWEPAEGGGIWIYLQETYRGPHSKDERTVRELLEQGAYESLGVWSLEAPAGGLNYKNNVPTETPGDAAVREVAEETGVIVDASELIDLLPGGLHISGDINTKLTYLFAANVHDSQHEAAIRAVEEDEQISGLLAFHIRSIADIRELTIKTRRCSGTTPAIALIALHPTIAQYIS